MAGYLHECYARSLAEFGTPRYLAKSGAWILERTIPGINDRDAMSCYPLLCCRDWSKLRADLNDIGQELVSLSVVTDPFGDYDEAWLRECFRDKIIPFKQHFIIDLQKPYEESLSGNHRRNIRQASTAVQVEICREPLMYLNDWIDLYDHLIERHRIADIRQFSIRAFHDQFRIPGLVVFRAHLNGITLGMLLWYRYGDIGYYHLAAYNKTGYELKASFALFPYAIRYFTQAGVKYLNLGAGAGLKDGKQDGLTRFKSGWSNTTRTAYFCGRIFDPERYEEISRLRGGKADGYFPVYRQGEFE
ncbi:MAG: GNAT family N-acetyltransferase [Saprospiraceae bacterium]|nr:GNAT family N-acetyltransferase [Lewinella sp.]